MFLNNKIFSDIYHQYRLFVDPVKPVVSLKRLQNHHRVSSGSFDSLDMVDFMIFKGLVDKILHFYSRYILGGANKIWDSNSNKSNFLQLLKGLSDCSKHDRCFTFKIKYIKKGDFLKRTFTQRELGNEKAEFKLIDIYKEDYKFLSIKIYFWHLLAYSRWSTSKFASGNIGYDKNLTIEDYRLIFEKAKKILYLYNSGSFDVQDVDWESIK